MVEVGGRCGRGILQLTSVFKEWKTGVWLCIGGGVGVESLKALHLYARKSRKENHQLIFHVISH